MQILHDTFLDFLKEHLSILFKVGRLDTFSLCSEYTSVYESRHAGRWDVVQTYKTSGKNNLASKHTCTRAHTHSTYKLGAWQVLLAVSDTCGRNVGRVRQQARAELQHRFSLESRHANTLCGLKPRSPDCGLGCTADIAFGSEH